MGRLGWSADQALDTPMVYIHAALADHAESQVRFARMILGIPEPEEPDEDAEEASMNRAYEFFKRIGEENARKKEAGLG